VVAEAGIRGEGCAVALQQRTYAEQIADLPTEGSDVPVQALTQPRVQSRQPHVEPLLLRFFAADVIASVVAGLGAAFVGVSGAEAPAAAGRCVPGEHAAD
jgi:hypothetical protein